MAIANLAMSRSSSNAKSIVSCIVSSVSPGRPNIKKPKVSIPARLVIEIASLTWSFVMPFLIRSSICWLPDSTPNAA